MLKEKVCETFDDWHPFFTYIFPSPTPSRSTTGRGMILSTVLIYDVDPLVDCSCSPGYNFDSKCISPLIAARSSRAHVLEFLQVQVSNPQTNEGSEARKNHIFPRNAGSTYCSKITKRLPSTLFSVRCPHVRVATYHRRSQVGSTP
jgi:hypothetical protein